MITQEKNNRKQMLINDQYLSIKKIGQGGFGTVWKVYDFSLRNFITIKELLKEYTEPKYIEMFYKEALIAKNIIHDNIVRVQHFWKGSNGSYYISMDYVNGDDLENVIKKCNEFKIKIPFDLSLLIASNILKAIDHANRVAIDPITGKPYGIVYRDISPGNVLISFEGNVKLSDFGIAKTADDIIYGLKTKIVAGKYAYMSPEQIRGDTDIDHRSDIFSIGVLLYEMLTGKPLYEGTNEEIKTQVLETKFNSEQLTNLGIPDDLIEILSEALEKDKENRYEKAIEMFRDIRRFLKSKENEEITAELSSFMRKIMANQLKSEKESSLLVKILSVSDIKNDPKVEKFLCKDFIMGESIYDEEDTAQQSTKTLDLEKKGKEKEPEDIIDYPQEKKEEEKGKTVFEEVGDWFINNFKTYKKIILRGIIVAAVTVITFGIFDTFYQITPLGKHIFSRIYPPDILITTIPSGALVTMETRDGKILLQNADSTDSIKLRNIPPQTYIITAEKDGFKSVEKIVSIEEPTKDTTQKKQQQIEIYFDFMLRVTADINGASIFIDGNKAGETSWTGPISSGEHTIKFSYPGFEDLGSTAKETKKGQCSLNFSNPTISEMFAGIDPEYWKYELLNIEGNTIFDLKGTMIKKVGIKSIPTNMILHIKDENQDRGKTPVTIAFSSGEYLLRFMDPNGKYAETTKKLTVGKNSADEIIVKLKKWITLKIKLKNGYSEKLRTTVRVKGKNVDYKGKISSSKPLRLALPLGIYRITFFGNKKYETRILTNLNINKKNVIIGKMKYKRVPVEFLVRDWQTNIPIQNAKISKNEKVLGKTGKNGIWKGKIIHGTSTLKIEADQYIEKTITQYIKYDAINKTTLDLEPLEISKTEFGKYSDRLDDLRQSLEDMTSSVGSAVKSTTGLGAGKAASEALSDNVIDTIKLAPSPKTGKVVCQNCGAEHNVLPSKKLRFCTNCGKPLRQFPK